MWVKIREEIRHARNGGDTELLELNSKHDLPIGQARSLITQGLAEETTPPKEKSAKAPTAKAAASKRKAPAKAPAKPAPAEPVAAEPHLETAPAEVAAED